MRFTLFVCLTLALGGCVRPRPDAGVDLVAASRVPPLVDGGDRASLRAAAEQSLAYLTRRQHEHFTVGHRSIRYGDVRREVQALIEYLDTNPSTGDLDRWLRARFELVRPRDPVLFTGYYEPEVPASLVRTEEYTVPIYELPEDIVSLSLQEFSGELPDRKIAGRLDGSRLRPYWNREAIREKGALDARGLELAWGQSRLDVFFMEIQGSGTIVFPDGTEKRVGYAGANGRPYRSIGRLLIDEGKLTQEEVSMQSIRQYLLDNPDEVERVLAHNESFVFFTEKENGPIGNLGLPVTPWRTVATDQRVYPPGSLMFLSLPLPLPPGAEPETEPERVSRLVFNQDTGGAIRGPRRVDFFLGRGAAAGALAGRMKQEGDLFLLLPKVVTAVASRSR